MNEFPAAGESSFLRLTPELLEAFCSADDTRDGVIDEETRYSEYAGDISHMIGLYESSAPMRIRVAVVAGHIMRVLGRASLDSFLKIEGYLIALISEGTRMGWFTSGALFESGGLKKLLGLTNDVPLAGPPYFPISNRKATKVLTRWTKEKTFLRAWVETKGVHAKAFGILSFCREGARIIRMYDENGEMVLAAATESATFENDPGDLPDCDYVTCLVVNLPSRERLTFFEVTRN